MVALLRGPAEGARARGRAVLDVGGGDTWQSPIHLALLSHDSEERQSTGTPPERRRKIYFRPFGKISPAAAFHDEPGNPYVDMKEWGIGYGLSVVAVRLNSKSAPGRITYLRCLFRLNTQDFATCSPEDGP